MAFLVSYYIFAYEILPFRRSAEGCPPTSGTISADRRKVLRRTAES